MMTISQLEPSVLDIQTLQRTNAPVGCNENSSIVRYLIDMLKFKPKNIRKIDSISDYPTAFKNRDIEAAFFVAPHAKVFLAKYSCAGFVKAGDTFNLGGFGFAFPKDSSKLASDISEAVLNVIEDGETRKLEDDMMISTVSCSTSYDKNQEDRSLGIQPFHGLFYISAIVAVLAVLAWSYSIKDLLISELRNWMSHIQQTLSHFWIILLWRGIKAFMAQMYSEFQTGVIRRSSILGNK
ncbi:hypothetical protein K1719_007850 [Acacia pycnantha]|nr:hypothetical protein K1719_007850 [Acacia pycnantha]